MRITYETEMGDRAEMPLERLRARDAVTFAEVYEAPDPKLLEDAAGVRIRQGESAVVRGFNSSNGEVSVSTRGERPRLRTVGPVELSVPASVLVVHLDSRDPRVSTSRAMSATACTAAHALVAEMVDNGHETLAVLIAHEVSSRAPNVEELLHWAAYRLTPAPADYVTRMARVEETVAWLKNLRAKVRDKKVASVIHAAIEALDPQE